MSIGGLDGPHAIQSAAEAQRLQRQPAEATRGEEQAQRFAASLDEARRRRQVTGAGGGEAAGRAGNDPGSPGAGEGAHRPVDGDGRGQGGGGKRRSPHQGEDGGGPEADPAAPVRPGAATLSGDPDGLPAPPPRPRRPPLPEDLPLKGQRLDRTV